MFASLKYRKKLRQEFHRYGSYIFYIDSFENASALVIAEIRATGC